MEHLDDPARAAGPPPARAAVLGGGVAWTARWSLRLLLIALGVALVGLLIGQLWSIAFPVFLGLIIATVFEPPVTWLRAHRCPPLLATTLVFVIALLVLAGLVVGLIPSVSSQAPQIAQGAVAGIQQIQDWLGGPPFNLGQTQIGQAVDAATERLQQNASSIAGGVITGLTAIASGVVDAVLAIVLAFLFVKDGPRFLPWLGRIAGPSAGDHLAAVGLRAWSRLGGFIRSQAIIGLVDAVFIGVGLLVFGVPLALPLAVLTFFGAFIPIVGALVAGALSVLIALVIQGPAVALGVLALILVVQQVEGNLLQPLVQGKGLGLHAAVVILAVAAGGSLFGIPGAFLAVPVVAVAAEVLRYLGERVDARTGDAPVPADPSEPTEATGPGDATGPVDGTAPEAPESHTGATSSAREVDGSAATEPVGPDRS